MELIFEKSKQGLSNRQLPACDVPVEEVPAELLRSASPRLPELTEGEISRHYSALERRTHGVNNGFYPLGSCTMKYNPKINDEMASLEGFTGIHPLQPPSAARGCLELLSDLSGILCEITGMDDMTFQPAAGAHGEFCGIAMIRAWHKNRGDDARTKILVPDSAHGTNPASAAMNGCTVVSVPSREDGTVDVAALRAAMDDTVAALMLTNPNTLGLFDPNIKEITGIVHEGGGLCYYDGANLNAVMGIVRPGDMGFDVVHLNLHKSFSTPHGGGGPGSGAVGCKKELSPFLPAPVVRGGRLDTDRPASIGRIRSFYGNFLVCVRAYCYLLTLGKQGVPGTARQAVLNANYLLRTLAKKEEIAIDHPCMHEFVLSMKQLKNKTGVSALDVAKSLLDSGIHPPTMYFPLIVEEALMFEPTETESKQTLDSAAETFRAIVERAHTDPESLHAAPVSAPVGRPDEVTAARNPVVRCRFDA